MDDLFETVSLDNPDTWPSEIRTEIDALTGAPSSSEAEGIHARLGRLLVGHSIVGYHCSRLTDRELLKVRARCLRPLTNTMIIEKVDAAVATDDPDVEIIGRQHRADDSTRKNRIEVFGVRPAFRSPHFGAPMTTFWANGDGEAIAYPLERTEHQAKLRRVGVPTVIVAEVLWQDITRISRSPVFML